MNTEVKVGAFTLLGVVLLVGIMALLSGIRPGGDKGYNLSIGFPQAIGLTSGNDVCYAGVRIGKVSRVEPSGLGVVADVVIEDDVKIPSKIAEDADSFPESLFVIPGLDLRDILHAQQFELHCHT